VAVAQQRQRHATRSWTRSWHSVDRGHEQFFDELTDRSGPSVNVVAISALTASIDQASLQQRVQVLVDLPDSLDPGQSPPATTEP